MFIASSAFKDFVMSGVRVCLLGAILAVYLCCSALPVKARTTDPSEVAALEAIKSSLIDPLKNLKSWNKGDPCMLNWTGIVCYNTPLDDGYLHVKELHMLTMNLSGTLAADLGRLSYLQTLDFMWNEISGSIPKEIGNIKSLILLLLNGNQLSGSLPDELGYLPNLDRIQIDQNHISGPIPKSFAKLEKLKHWHMNNNSISGEIPPELSKLPILVHFLLDNNNLSGRLPPELSQLPNLRILQLDNNNFHGSEIPASYSNMSKLLKLSLRNCSLQGAIPDLSSITHLLYLDLSWNHLTGSIPSNKLSDNITTIELAYNNLNGSIPTIFSDFPFLQKLSLENNSLSGFVPSIWQSMTFGGNRRLFLYFQNNLLSNISGVLNPPANVTIIILNVDFNLCSVPTSSVGTVGGLQGNPICVNANQFNIVKFCGSQNGGGPAPGGSTNLPNGCPIQACPTDYFFEYVPAFSPGPCFCAAPLQVGYRLKSPGVSDFPPYKPLFEGFLTSHLSLHRYQLVIDSFAWEAGPRLRMYLKLFPVYDDRPSFFRRTFNESEIFRIKDMFTDWRIPNSDLFGPAELLNFTLLGPYSNVIVESSKSGISKGVLAAIVLGAVAGTLTISSIISILIMRRRTRHYHLGSKRRLLSKISIKIDGVKDFTFGEMALATSNFGLSTQVGQGGYGKVYRGILADGTVVAIKRAQEGSLQGTKEFLTEIELLSRLHHRNLVSLLGYCDEEDEQMLVYEFMPNGTLRDHLSAKAKLPLSFTTRLHIAICSAKGILYLHMEADPPIFHRDIKASNILLDSNFTAKVADFGLSRLASLPEIDGSVPGYVSTIVKGTPGYLDPEYVLTHKLTDKSDVYSLGVVFLELLTGMQAISHGKNIVREVNLAYQSGLMFSVIDSRMGSYPSECVEQFVSLALRCVHDETDERPSMAEVVRELEIIWRRMPEVDITPSEFTATDAGSRPLPSSSYSTTDPFSPSKISGSDLQSSVAPIIRPR